MRSTSKQELPSWLVHNVSSTRMILHELLAIAHVKGQKSVLSGVVHVEVCSSTCKEEQTTLHSWAVCMHAQGPLSISYSSSCSKCLYLGTWAQRQQQVVES